ncbi:MAG: acetone carboxylase subunit gamma [Actinobacteria bacterium]|nr:acetone carboxylase subunit gamma [Actinomycetota bacterium]MBU1944044.1 acetone carboxylase subunit gamma [Actinomycetota bacterium]MBU2688539.1 acetone carboxylase subunit gamma [Actinomycetota bacterium]
MARRQITEYLDIDLDSEMWCCNRCGAELVNARDNYKRGCLVYERDPRTVHNPVIEGEFTRSPHPDYCRIIEFYCPSCGVMVENEYLPPGHPITHDIELDIESLKAKHATAAPAGGDE